MGLTALIAIHQMTCDMTTCKFSFSTLDLVVCGFLIQLNV